MNMENKKIEHTEKTDDELRSIAADIYEGKIFTDRHCRSESDIRMTFMPLVLGGLKDRTEEELKDIGIVYEYMSAAGPMAHNGMPIFFSCRFLNVSEMKRMEAYYEKYKMLKEDFLTDNLPKIDKA